MNRHTPGPWKVEVGGSERDIIVSDERGRTIAETNASCYSEFDSELPDMSVEEAMANSRLIAASPDLLEALNRLMPVPLTGNPSTKTLREFWEYEQSQGRGDAEDVLFAMDSIAKATGGAK